MSKFLIEVPHEAEAIACARGVQALLSFGSHFVANTDWGCADGVHKGWIVVDVDSREEARALLPPAFRSDATIVQLNRFTLEEMDDVLTKHQKK